MDELPAHALSEVLIRVQDPSIRVLSLVCTSWRSLIEGSPHLMVAILVQQLRGTILVKALSQDPPLIDIVQHLPRDFYWDIEVTEALDHACHKGLTEVVELLLMKGAEVEGLSEYSPLYLACRRGHVAVAKMLIEHGARVMPEIVEDEMSSTTTPLHAACEGGYPDVAKLLLEKGADVNDTDERWMAPLHLACTVYPDRNEMSTVYITPSEYACIAARLHEDEDEDEDED
jgi:hypothetical protein